MLSIVSLIQTFYAVNGALIPTGQLETRDHAKLEKVPARPDQGAPDPVLLCVSAWREGKKRKAIKSSGGRISFGTEVHPPGQGGWPGQSVP